MYVVYYVYGTSDLGFTYSGVNIEFCVKKVKPLT